jgi:hypothetical protein
MDGHRVVIGIEKGKKGDSHQNWASPRDTHTL